MKICIILRSDNADDSLKESILQSWAKNLPINVKLLFTEEKSLPVISDSFDYYYIGTNRDYIVLSNLSQFLLSRDKSDFFSVKSACIANIMILSKKSYEAYALTGKLENIEISSQIRGCDMYGKNLEEEFCCSFYDANAESFDKMQKINNIIACSSMNSESMREYHRYLPVSAVPPVPPVNKNWTFVTCLFDVAKALGKPSIRNSNGQYLERAKYTMSLRINLVIYCDTEFVDFFAQERAKHGLMQYTKIIAYKLTDSYVYAYKKQIENKINQCWHDTLDKDTGDMLTIIYCNKFNLLDLALQNRYFETSNITSGKHFYGWFDIGLYKTGGCLPHQLYRAMELYREKCSFCYMNFTPREIVMNLPQYYEFGRRTCAGGFFTGEKSHMLTLCNLYKNKFIETINAGYLYAEEQLIPPIAFEHPDLFEFFYGQNNLVVNYDNIRREIDIIFNQYISTTRLCGENNLCLNACKKMYTAMLNETIFLTLSQKIRLADEMFISAYYCHDDEFCLKAMQMIDFPEFDDLITDHIIKNTDYYRLSNKSSALKILDTRGVEDLSEHKIIKKLADDNCIIYTSSLKKYNHYSLCHRKFILLPIDANIKHDMQIF